MRMKHLSEQERLLRAQPFLSSVSASMPQAAKKPSTNELSKRSLNVLIKAALEPGIWLLAIYTSLNLHPAEGQAAVKDLLARAMVRTHRLVRRGRGAMPQGLEVLVPGKNELAKRGVEPATRILKGGFKHNVYGLLVEKSIKPTVRRFHFEYTLGAKTFDGVGEGHDGSLTGYEIVLSGTATPNADLALKGASVAGIEEVVLCCEDRKLMKNIDAKLLEIDALGMYRPKISFRHLSEFVAV